MLKLFLWLRYLHKKKIVLLSIAAVALSVTLMVATDSIFTGYIEGLREMTVADYGDIVVWPNGTDINDFEIFIERLERNPDIEAAAPYLFAGGLLFVEGGYVRAVSVSGIDPVHEEGFTDWSEKLLSQKEPSKIPDFSVPDHSDLPGVWLGINIIAEPDEETDEYDFDAVKQFIGRQVLLTMRDQGLKRRVFRFRVSDIVFSKMFFSDQSLYLPYEHFESIAFGRNNVKKTRIVKIRVKDGTDPRSLVDFIKARWAEFAVETMNFETDAVPTLVIRMQQDWHRELFEDLRNQMRVVLLIFGVICSVAVLLIFCIFYMIVTAKQKDIAVIKSCGASSTAAAMIFAGFGACVGIAGSGLGVILGIIITKNVNVLEGWVRAIFGIKLWRTSSYGLAYIPHQVHWSSIPPIVIAAVLGCIVGVLIPSIIAARAKPVEILRYE